MSKANVVHVGKNIEGTLDGNILTLKIDLSKRLGDSKSGKTTIVATSGGNQPVGMGVILGINAYTKI